MEENKTLIFSFGDEFNPFSRSSQSVNITSNMVKSSFLER